MPSSSPAAATARTYGRTFWLCYLANISCMVAVSSLFRYADFVHVIGGTVGALGLIVGVGAIGSVAVRFFQGVAIDHIGPRRVWLFSLALLVTALLLHLKVRQVDGLAVYAVRILYTVGLAGAFGSSLTFISLIAPPGRMGELLGMMGTSGFIGMAIGPRVSDWLLAADPSRSDVDRMFLVAAAMGGVSWVLATAATWGVKPPAVRRRVPRLAALRRYHPGTLLLVAAAMGLGLGLPTVFLRDYTRELKIGGIGQFFFIYACAAFCVRVATRRASDRLGYRPVILVGLTCLATSMVLYLLVSTAWSLAIPAVCAGAAHALLFPAVLSGGNAAFPARHRGLAITLMLTLFDFGTLLGQPLVGGSLELIKGWGLPEYPIMFVSTAVVLLLVNGVFYMWPPKNAPPVTLPAASDDARPAAA